MIGHSMDSRRRRVRNKLDRRGFNRIEIREFRDSVILEGELSRWEDKILAGYTAAHRGYNHVINDIRVSGIEEERFVSPSDKDGALEGKYFDVAVIGGGIIGSAIARELTRSNLTVVLLEKEEDLATHASGRNDGMIHPGFAASPGTKKALYNVRGNRAYTEVCRDLDVPLSRNGSFMLYRDAAMLLLTPIFYRRARLNKVEGAHFVGKGLIRKMEPYLTSRQKGGFFFPSAGQLSPYRLTYAYAENAVQNGCSLFLETAVKGFEMEGPGRISRIMTNRGTFSGGIVVNAAGIWTDVVAGFAGDRFFSIHGRKGVDALLDIKTGKYQKRIAALVGAGQLKSHTKGGGLVPTVEGNILVGPTADEVPYRENYTTTPEDMEKLLERLEVNTMFSPKEVITYFAGIRACTYEEDFIVGPSDTVENLIHVAGIQSPGLASAPAIAEDVAQMCRDLAEKRIKDVKPNPSFTPRRTAPPIPRLLSEEKRAELVKKDPSYARIICRCEEVSEGEIRDALLSPVPAATLDGVKRRTRGGMGRCQGGFCTPRIMEIIHEATGIPMEKITKKGQGSEILYGRTPKGEEEERE